MMGIAWVTQLSVRACGSLPSLAASSKYPLIGQTGSVALVHRALSIWELLRRQKPQLQQLARIDRNLSESLAVVVKRSPASVPIAHQSGLTQSKLIP